jgi:thiosulfate reductase cytochrome b subunit
LYVLLPLQIISGLMMLSVQQWPQISDWLGGLNYLAPFHSMVAWLFATFLIAHIYLATTGATPLTAYQAMISGWEDLEVHPDEDQPEEQHG